MARSLSLCSPGFRILQDATLEQIFQTCQEARPCLETVECGNHKILIFSTSLSNVLDGQACLLSARPDSYQSQGSSSLTHPQVGIPGKAHVMTASDSLCSLSMAPVKQKSSRCQSRANCPTSPYWKQESIHSLPTVPHKPVVY